MTQFDIRDPAFSDLFPDGAGLQEIATGFGFTEGPIWHPHDKWLMFSDIQESKQYIWREGAGHSIFRQPSNQANGNFFDRDGQVLTCEHAASQVTIHDHSGKRVRPIATHYEGRALNSPNDVICDSLGRIWFTDPAYGRTRADLGIIRDQELAFQGVYRLDPDGSLHLVARDFDQPNGLCLSQDETRLFINDSPRGHIRVFDVAADGALSGGEIWANVVGDGPWVPDGMKTTTQDHILCNGPSGVHVFTADAQCLGVILMPQKSTNFCFGGADMTSLFITASASVYRIETRMTGLAMF
ncbi:SMP-30/gluconolactonase/LRE family protein [Loktanella sp. F6476L]|uniref:SMP-30/gluconolactonase/LRE family protein n=1 Tax=Loktanella sp. F6476L TaxID=2926405 RepID=UPI001FF3089C|nr:SMP-30/gluconolactonase/LRE family protein [Loktanella sp. F6476L]MCK0120688.1 SMP-30/gluconolactonase/LRE family protein [Loktanella sp. F6476L]